jgi:hypothetical protein
MTLSSTCYTPRQLKTNLTKLANFQVFFQFQFLGEKIHWTEGEKFAMSTFFLLLHRSSMQLPSNYLLDNHFTLYCVKGNLIDAIMQCTDHVLLISESVLNYSFMSSALWVLASHICLWPRYPLRPKATRIYACAPVRLALTTHKFPSGDNTTGPHRRDRAPF